MNDFTIVILEKMKTLAIRMRRTLEGSRICVVDAENGDRLMNKLIGDTLTGVSLVILDLEIEQSYAMDLLIETKKRVKDTPIIVLTSGGKRNFFVEAMLQGASDFIIKPFNDETLIAKVFKYLMPETENKMELVALDLNRYIRGELRKAEKGSFPLSMMFLHFDNGKTDLSKDTRTSLMLFNSLRDLFWDTDVFIRFAAKYYLGVFPFCDEKNTEIVKGKMEMRFKELKETDPALEGYEMQCIFVSYPFDTTQTSEVYNLLIERINENFDHIRL